MVADYKQATSLLKDIQAKAAPAEVQVCKFAKTASGTRAWPL